MVKQPFQFSLQVSVDGVSDLNCASFLPFVRMYPIKEVPVEAEALSDWLYQRFVEKEELLAHFYDTGLSAIPASLVLGQNTREQNDSAPCAASAPPVDFERTTVLFPMATDFGHGANFNSQQKSLHFQRRSGEQM